MNEELEESIFKCLSKEIKDLKIKFEWTGSRPFVWVVSDVFVNLSYLKRVDLVLHHLKENLDKEKVKEINGILTSTWEEENDR